jgi:hypothetical protein
MEFHATEEGTARQRHQVAKPLILNDYCSYQADITLSSAASLGLFLGFRQGRATVAAPCWKHSTI